MSVQSVRAAVEDDFGEELAERGRVHDAVAGGVVVKVAGVKPAE